MKSYMLTTSDNPINPFDNFDEWLKFDMDHGYNSSAYLDRQISEMLGSYSKFDSLSDAEQTKMIENAIDAIIFADVTNVYRKVSNDEND